MVADGVLGQEQPLGDLPVRQPSGDLLQDFEFALGQPRPAVSRRDYPGEAAADTEGAKPPPDAGRVPGSTCTVVQLKPRLAEPGDTLYWVTDSFYQAMFLTTRDGVVLIDAPPTIGHQLLRAIEAITFLKPEAWHLDL
jgi:hypothetical protein